MNKGVFLALFRGKKAWGLSSAQIFLLSILTGTAGNLVSALMLDNHFWIVFSLNSFFFMLTISSLYAICTVFNFEKNTILLVYFLTTFLLTFPSFWSTTRNTNKKTYEPITLSESEKAKLLDEVILRHFPTDFQGKGITLGFISLIALIWVVLRNKYDFKFKLSFIGIFLLGVLIIWNNTSFGSPYSWVPNFESTGIQHFYVVHPAGDSIALVNADEFVHSSLVSLFNNGAFQNLMLIQRAFSYYLVSHLVNYLDLYNSWIILNLALLGFLIFLLLQFVSLKNVSRLNRVLITSTICMNPLMITFVGQSSGYFSALFMSIFLFLFLKKASIKKGIYNNQFWSVVIIFTLANFTYNHILWQLVLVFWYQISNKISYKQFVTLTIIPFTVAIVYRYLFIPQFELPIDTGNESQITDSIKLAGTQLFNPSIDVIVDSIWTGVLSTFQIFSLIFVPLSLVVLLVLIMLASSRTYVFEEKNLIILIILAVIFMQVVFTLGKMQSFGLMPRLSSFVLVGYLLIAKFLAQSISRVNFLAAGFIAILSINILYGLRLMDGWEIFFLHIVGG